ncbi:MAG TPA: FtsQ-type POTRA domain-containing protein [bacterium]|nr:FtsQ-type POTRA domain-containing protein [bacterium]
MREEGKKSAAGAATRTVKIGARALKGPKTVRTASRPGRSAAGGGARRRGLVQGRLFRAVAVIVVVSGVGAGLGAGAKELWSYLTHSPRFAIKEIVVRTGKRVTEREIRMLADLKEGDNILGFRLSDCVAGIQIHPWVKRASVMRQFPDRVVIEVEEREPVALLSLGSLYYVDADGEIFKKLLPGDVMDYPVLSGITLREVVEGKARIDPLLRLGLDVIAVAKQSRIFPARDISEVRLDRVTGAVVVRASDGMLVRVGAGELAGKWRRLERTLVELGDETKKVAELDLNYEGRVTVKLKEGYRVAAAGAAAMPGGL